MQLSKPWPHSLVFKHAFVVMIFIVYWCLCINRWKWCRVHFHTRPAKKYAWSRWKSNIRTYELWNGSLVLRQLSLTIDLKIDIPDRVFILTKIVATFDVEHPIHGTTYGPKWWTQIGKYWQNIHCSTCVLLKFDYLNTVRMRIDQIQA